MVNHHFSTPLGRICFFLLFPSILSKFQKSVAHLLVPFSGEASKTCTLLLARVGLKHPEGKRKGTTNNNSNNNNNNNNRGSNNSSNHNHNSNSNQHYNHPHHPHHHHHHHCHVHHHHYHHNHHHFHFHHHHHHHHHHNPISHPFFELVAVSKNPLRRVRIRILVTQYDCVLCLFKKYQWSLACKSCNETKTLELFWRMMFFAS